MTEGTALYFAAVLALATVANGIWRLFGVILAAHVDEKSRFFAWIRMVATALVAALVGQLVFHPAGVFALVPLWLRLGSLVAGGLAYWFGKRSLALGIVVGEAVLIGTTLALGLL